MHDSTFRGLRNALALTLALVACAAQALGAPLAGLGGGAGALLIGDTVSTTDMDAALKIIFGDALVNNVVSDSEILKYIPNGRGIKRDRTTGGRYIETAQMFRLPAGFGFRSEGDYIPVPNGPAIENSRVNLKKGLGAVEMNSEVLKRVRSDMGAYVAWGREALPRLVNRATNEIDRAMLGFGAGVKARVNATTPATTLVIDSPMGISTLGLTAKDALFHFLPGETIVAGPNIDGSGLRSGVMLVEDYDWANNAIVVDALATGLADDDYLFPGDSQGNSIGKEPMGLFGVVDDGSVLATFQNIARADWSAWRGIIVDAQASPFSAGQTLTEKVIMWADDECYLRGGGKIDLFICSRQGTRQVWADLVADRAINDPASIQGGRGRVSVLLGDRLVAMRAARKMPSTAAFGLTLKTWRKWVLHEWQWDDQTGSIWKQVIDSGGRRDAYWAYGGLLYECGNEDPQKNFRIQNCADVAFT